MPDLFITTSPTIQVSVFLVHGKGSQAIVSVLVNKTPAFLASVVLNFTWREEKSIFSVRR